MKLMKQLTALALSSLLAVSCVSAFAETPSKDIVLRESTAKFSVEVKRVVNSKSNVDYQLKLTNTDTVKLDNLVLEFDYDGNLTSNNTSRYNLTKASNNHYIMVFTNKWDGQSLAAGLSKSYDIKGNNVAGNVFENVLLSSSQRPVKETRISQWQLHGVYTAGQIVGYNGKFYRVIQSHTADAFNWTPALTPALFVKTKAPSTTVYNVILK